MKYILIVFIIGILLFTISKNRTMHHRQKTQTPRPQTPRPQTPRTQGRHKFERFENIIDRQLTQFPHIPKSLVLAIMESESSFNPRAYRHEAHINDSSRGLMQLLSRTATWLGHRGTLDDLFDPEINISLGIKFIDWLFRQFPNNLEGVIMSYNMGIGNYRRGRRVMTYYNRVRARMKKYEDILRRRL